MATADVKVGKYYFSYA